MLGEGAKAIMEYNSPKLTIFISTCEYFTLKSLVHHEPTPVFSLEFAEPLFCKLYATQFQEEFSNAVIEKLLEGA